MGRRTLLLIAAFVVAALGTSLVFLYVQGVDDRAIEDQQPVQVLVAKTQIPAGTTGAQAESAQAFELTTIAKDSAADGALSSTAEIKDQVALAPIFPGEQILRSKFGAAGTGALAIPKGQLAMSVQMSDPARVAGFVQPGSEVAVFVTLDDAAAKEAVGAEVEEAGSGGASFTATLLDRVKVIAVGQSTTTTTTTTTPEGEETTEQIPRAILTLAVSQADASKIVYAQGKGQLYFGLLTKDSSTRSGQPQDSTTLFEPAR